MAQKLIIVYLSSMFLTAILTKLLIPLLKSKHLGQPILKYVTVHQTKQGTPTMGGLSFLISALVISVFIKGYKGISLICLLIFIIYAALGFSDDIIKIKFARNEGLTPKQKIFFEVLISLIAAIYAYLNNLCKVYIPFTDKLIDLGFMYIPFCIFVFLATSNCVNLTDGLDGLAGSVCTVIFTALSVIIMLQTRNDYYVDREEYYRLSLLSMSVAGGLIGYLMFNVNRAKIFMGDTGSLSLGGLMASLHLFSANALYLPISGIMIVVSGISVILQVAIFKLKRKRIFLMAPIHHHFQLKGATEGKISFYYGAITLIFCLFVIVFYV